MSYGDSFANTRFEIDENTRSHVILEVRNSTTIGSPKEWHLSAVQQTDLPAFRFPMKPDAAREALKWAEEYVDMVRKYVAAKDAVAATSSALYQWIVEKKNTDV